MARGVTSIDTLSVVNSVMNDPEIVWLQEVTIDRVKAFVDYVLHVDFEHSKAEIANVKTAVVQELRDRGYVKNFVQDAAA